MVLSGFLSCRYPCIPYANCAECGECEDDGVEKEETDVQYDFLTADLRFRHPFGNINVKDVKGARRPNLFRSALEDDSIPTPPKFPETKWKSTAIGQALVKLRQAYPYITLEDHYLYAMSELCVWELMKNSGRASHVLARLKQQVQLEEELLPVLYKMFKQPGFEELWRLTDVQLMLEYFGLPSDKEDARKFVDVVDKDDDLCISLEEFHTYVGRLGGSVKVFEGRLTQVRKAEDSRAGLLSEHEDLEDVAKLDKRLQDVGFENADVAYWRLMLPLSELNAVAELLPCQKASLKQIRSLAKKNHDRTLVKLQWRMKALGYSKQDLWMTLQWIREYAPIIIQVNIDKIVAPLNVDTHYRNQFETGLSGGCTDITKRAQWERDLFMGNYDTPDVLPCHRVKYGVLNVMNDYRGVSGTEAYGDSYLVLKNVRLRCTFAPQDSANLKADKLAVLDYFGHELMEYTDAELKEVVKVALSRKPVTGNSCVVKFENYKEAQIHGEIDFKRHIDRLVVHDRHNTGYMPDFLKEICEKHGFELSWMSNEKKRMLQKRNEQLDPAIWDEVLGTLAKPPDVVFRY